MGDPRGETVYAGFPESLDSGVPQSGIKTSPEGRARGEGWIGRARSFTEEQGGTSIDENAAWQASMPEVIGVVVFAARFSWISLINPNFRPGKHRQNVVAGSDTRALFP